MRKRKLFFQIMTASFFLVSNGTYAQEPISKKIDPDAWAGLFKKSGAVFAGPVAIHHAGFAMWDSEITPWNAADMGPKRDITGALEKAIKKQGLKFITTFHHATNGLYIDSKNNKLKYPEMGHFVPRLEGTSVTSHDTNLQLLYTNLPKQEYIDRLWYRFFYFLVVCLH